MAGTFNCNIVLRNDTADRWTTVNPILAKGEVGLETGTNQFKIGDGRERWNDLPYAAAPAVVVREEAPSPSDVDHRPGTIWVNSGRAYLLYETGEQAVWKQVVTPEELSALGSGDMLKSEYAASGRPGYVDQAVQADSADRLSVSRTISVTGDVAAQAQAFDGTADITLTAALKEITTAGTGSKITFNSKGLVTGTQALTADDLPDLPLGKITGAGTAAGKNIGTAEGDVPALGVSGKLDESLLPALHLTASDVGARPDSWTPTAAEVGAAAADHTHTPASIGAAASGHTHSAATTSAAGFMSAADKTKLNGVATGANNYVLPVAGTALGGVKNGGNVTVNEDGTMTAPEGGGGDVSSVNGKTGAVTLAAADVGALGKTAQTVTDWNDATSTGLYQSGGDAANAPDSAAGVRSDTCYGLTIDDVQFAIRNNYYSRNPWAGLRIYMGSGHFSEWFPFIGSGASTVQTVTDWDNAYKTGYYYACNAANAPSETSTVLAWVICEEVSGDGIQFAWQRYSPAGLYVRYFTVRDWNMLDVSFGTWQNIFSLST
ncbi:hypothetical protein [Ligaoa zhengdingensis]|uniref:hyaluronate lyase N-terminal domain-containing protein n=1 Tax=Ligaoa zhengdingensis TaxID=2763658 RepID=UPI0031BBB4D0